jgi:hypothetical protein
MACFVALGRTCFSLSSRAQLDLQGGYFSGFGSSVMETAKAEKFVAYRKRRPERPPAGKIACHTKGQS